MDGISVQIEKILVYLVYLGTLEMLSLYKHLIQYCNEMGQSILYIDLDVNDSFIETL